MGEGFRRRHIVRNGKGTLEARCHVANLEDTDHASVKTAILACGTRIRYDVPRSGKYQATAVCPACTKLLHSLPEPPLGITRDNGPERRLRTAIANRDEIIRGLRTQLKDAQGRIHRLVGANRG